MYAWRLSVCNITRPSIANEPKAENKKVEYRNSHLIQNYIWENLNELLLITH